jgi:hypothetical protein
MKPWLSNAIDGAVLILTILVVMTGMAMTLAGCSAAQNRQVVRGIIELAPEACLLLDPAHPEVCTYLEDLKALEPLLAAKRAARLKDGGVESAADAAAPDGK